MADMLFMYLSGGFLNQEIKFSHFIRRFIVPLEGDIDETSKINFLMLDDDRNGHISIPELIRVYLELPKTCEYAEELRNVFR